jgi:hypothetical protein
VPILILVLLPVQSVLGVAYLLVPKLSLLIVPDYFPGLISRAAG